MRIQRLGGGVLGRLSSLVIKVHSPWTMSVHVVIWLRTNGVNTNGAAAKVINFDRLGKKVRPGTFGNIKAG